MDQKCSSTASADTVDQSSSINAKDILQKRSSDHQDNKSGNFFKFPPEKREQHPMVQRLLDYFEYENCFNESSQSDAETLGRTAGSQLNEMGQIVCVQQIKSGNDNYTQFQQGRVEPTSHLPDLSTDEAIEKLSSLYSILEELSNIGDTLNDHAHKEYCLNKDTSKQETKYRHNRVQLEQSYSLPDATLMAGSIANKLNDMKQQRQRERSKSTIGDDICTYHREKGVKHGFSRTLHLLSRQNSYGDRKSKVSKWTKVKAAFKWERANMPTLSEVNKSDRMAQNVIGLVPNNFEVARYLRVNSRPYGGTSSADSILSSTSGHVLSEVATPGTISSASSIDDIKNSFCHAMTGDFSIDGLRNGMRISDEEPQTMGPVQNKSHSEAELLNHFECLDGQTKTYQKHYAVSNLKTGPENFAVIVNCKQSQRLKQPPSPLNLNLKHDLNDMEDLCAAQHIRSPKECRQSCYNHKIISSPGNSSVPSSPSRLSDFFAELESEELSSGEFSDSTAPYEINLQMNYQQKQDEVHKKYEMLRKKLDLEFKAKRHNWEKSRANPNVCRASAYTMVSSPKVEVMPPSHTDLSAKLIEESLSPDFKKKLQKWRVKKQTSLGTAQSQHMHPVSPNSDCGIDSRLKIDWHLWKTGQIKLEGQGLSPLPHEKDLPEEFQKKLEQWHHIKKSSSMVCTYNNCKRLTKYSDCGKKGAQSDHDGDTVKNAHIPKSIKKDKLERLAKLKTIVPDHAAKEIQVKTSDGVMKFEGISRKFTRKLYEWEKARGIGPESSTFALLHPGYCPLDVGKITKSKNSPVLSRSLSLNSISPNINLAVISQQASSLSLNDVNDLKDIDATHSNDALSDTEFKKFDEPEAVIVEVEDHIIETASPLITTETLAEQQRAVYKYVEGACGGYCNMRHIQSYESCTNSAPLLNILERTNELIEALLALYPDVLHNEEIFKCQTALTRIRNLYPHFVEKSINQRVLTGVDNVQSEVTLLNQLQQMSPLDEACCQEIMEERCRDYSKHLHGLQAALDLLHLNIQGVEDIQSVDISILSEDGMESPINDDAKRTQQISSTLEATDEQSVSLVENEVGSSIAINRNLNSNGNLGTPTVSKKKLRSRKLGSRQNSKTESNDSSEEDTNSLLETPRRLKRKNFRLKQRSFEEATVKVAPVGYTCLNEDKVYVLKIKPGQPIEQCEFNDVANNTTHSNVLISPTGFCVQLLPIEAQSTPMDVSFANSQNTNIFVKTKRKIFKTIEEPNSASGIAFVEQDLDSLNDDIAVIYDRGEVNREVNITQLESDSNQFQDIPLESQTCKDNEYQTAEEPQPQNKKVAEIKKYAAHPLSRRAWSWNDVRAKATYKIPKSHSTGSFKNWFRHDGCIRAPLATDSFKVIQKNCALTTKLSDSDHNYTQTRRNHRYRKNTESGTGLIGKHNTVMVKKKIQIKISKTNTGSVLTADKERMEINRPENRATASLNLNQPVLELLPSIYTPLSERAQRLLKAKQDFLQDTKSVSVISSKHHDETVEHKTHDHLHASFQNKENSDAELSDISVRNMSVETASTYTPAKADAGVCNEISEISDSLSREVSRSVKISSKLGFATLASKLRLVRCKPDKLTNADVKSATVKTPKLNLMKDGTAFTNLPNLLSEDSVKKSKSSEAIVINDSVQRLIHGSLNKSQSEQHVMLQKESYV